MKIFVVDSFTDKLFSGNPAAVCPLSEWIGEELMQKIAAENNLSETAFFVKEQEGYRIRWFTPAAEVDLCGHATLAASHVLFNHLEHNGDEVIFNSRSGPLTVTKSNDLITLNFPIDKINEIDAEPELIACFSKAPIKTFKGKTDFMFVYDDQSDIENMTVDFQCIAKQNARGVIITAPGNEVDVVSRFFAPLYGIDEDPVTGSAHTTLIPYWSNELNKTSLSARQLSKRGGELHCELSGDRIFITGKATTYMSGNISIN